MCNLIATHIPILNLVEKSPLFAVFPVFFFFFHSAYILMCQSRHLGVTLTHTYRHLAMCVNVFPGLSYTVLLFATHTNNYLQEDMIIR